MARLVIKHAVGGRTFVDSDANQQVRFEIKKLDMGTTLIIAHLPEGLDKDVAELLKWKQELNIFIFEVLYDGREQKTWFYTGDGDIQYNETERILRLGSSREIRYLPSNYLM
ncbi:hypothetical protein [Paenibacillus sacheonensis]|uniref:Uncharacterized protein n=1 Tax=Paenibacillus sacheonensis TaxID=742054 RepID=A0A7X5BZK3_9BACL|nr:hypothetical protein [Paenibacillus sacheonensis]MBM7569052.1 hypothetical protein [Paenibacillus sacheonensis]NBC72768.1 hypothetical protein [Paenibacillus sacheonensis]